MGRRRSAFDLLAHPEIDLGALVRIWPELEALPRQIGEQIEIEARYASYLERQEADIRAFRRDEALALPELLDYDRVGGLSKEAQQVLAEARPATLGAAARLPGITPAAVVALLRYVKKSGPGSAEDAA